MKTIVLNTWKTTTTGRISMMARIMADGR